MKVRKNRLAVFPLTQIPLAQFPLAQFPPPHPLNYARLKDHFTTFTTKMGIDSDVRNVLLDICRELEGLFGDQPSDARRLSILDPAAPKLGGPRTTTTSARVDHRSACPGTKMVHNFLSQTKTKTTAGS